MAQIEKKVRKGTKTYEILTNLEKSKKEFEDHKNVTNILRLEAERVQREREKQNEVFLKYANQEVLNLIERIRTKSFVEFMNSGTGYSSFLKIKFELANIISEIYFADHSLNSFMWVGLNNTNDLVVLKSIEKDLRYLLSHFNIKFEIKPDKNGPVKENLWLHFIVE